MPPTALSDINKHSNRLNICCRISLRHKREKRKSLFVFAPGQADLQIRLIIYLSLRAAAVVGRGWGMLCQVRLTATRMGSPQREESSLHRVSAGVILRPSLCRESFSGGWLNNRLKRPWNCSWGTLKRLLRWTSGNTPSWICRRCCSVFSGVGKWGQPRKQAKKQTNLTHANTYAQQRLSGEKNTPSILSSLSLSLPPVGICLMGLTGEQRGLATTWVEHAENLLTALLQQW